MQGKSNQTLVLEPHFWGDGDQATLPQEGPQDPVNPSGQTPPNPQEESEIDPNNGVVYTVEELTELAASENVDDRLVAAQNTLTPSRLLNKLARDPEVRVRVAVAANPSLDLIAMGFLSRDSVAKVRLSVAQNPSVTAAIIKTLLGDNDELVREAAEKAAQRLGWG